MFQTVYKDMYIETLENENKVLKDWNREFSDGWYASRVDYWKMKEELEMWIEDYKTMLLKNKEFKESLTAVVVRMFCE